MWIEEFSDKIQLSRVLTTKDTEESSVIEDTNEYYDLITFSTKVFHKAATTDKFKSQIFE